MCIRVYLLVCVHACVPVRGTDRGVITRYKDLFLCSLYMRLQRCVCVCIAGLKKMVLQLFLCRITLCQTSSTTSSDNVITVSNTTSSIQCRCILQALIHQIAVRKPYTRQMKTTGRKAAHSQGCHADHTCKTSSNRSRRARLTEKQERQQAGQQQVPFMPSCLERHLSEDCSVQDLPDKSTAKGRKAAHSRACCAALPCKVSASNSR